VGEIGLAGHSYGAAAVSYIGQWDPRVKAIVAWDNLGGVDPNASFIGSNPSGHPCPGDPIQRAVAKITKPALGLHGDADELVPTVNGRLLAEGIPGARLVLYSGARHGFHVEFAARSASDTLAFLDSVPAAAPA